MTARNPFRFPRKSYSAPVMGWMTADEAACEMRLRSVTFVAMAPRRLTVVYADDDDLVRETIWRLLIEELIDVHACKGGAQAIELCRQLNPDAALLDLNMPDPDGLETARRLRRNPGSESLRLVALTGRGTWDLRRKAMDAGFDEFLTKPVSSAVLIRALQAGITLR